MAQPDTPGPARRSARIGSVAPRSVASQSAVSVVISQETTRTPGRPKALPKVKTRQSNAYGATGRIGVALALTIPQTGFAEAFQAQRGAAIDRNQEEQRSSSAGRTPSASPEPGTPSQSDYESEDPPSEEESEDEDFSGDTSKSFGLSHEAGMLRGPTPQKQTPKQNKAVTPGAVASAPRRPIDSHVDRNPIESARRIPPVNPVNAPFAERPARPAAQEAMASGSTPRAHVAASTPGSATIGFTPRVHATPAQEPNTGLRAPPVRAPPASRIGGQTPRIPTDRPIQTTNTGSTVRTNLLRTKQPLNGEPTAPQAAPPRTDPKPVSEPEVRLRVRLVNKIKAIPWLPYALGAVAALAIALLASALVTSAMSTESGSGWKGFTGRLTPGSFSSKTPKDDVNLSLKDIQQFIHSIGDDVPDYVVVSRSPSGTIDVPKQFWDAIISRIRTEGPSIEWDTFVQHNQELLQHALGTEAAVVRKDLFKAIDNSFEKIAVDFDNKLESHTKIMMKDAMQVANKEAKKVAVEHARLRSAALSNLIANIELQYSQINYFSTGLGANIITAITSPTLSSHTVSASFMWVMNRMMTSTANPPTAALQSWDEPGDCWCAASNEDGNGKAQLGIQLGEPIIPTQLTIEHPPRSSLPDDGILNAPQHVELWVESKEPALVRFNYDGEGCEDGPEGWQCLGKVRYDTRGSNHVQTFLLDGEAQTPVDKVLVRVTSNWGAPNTCIYRVRLHGKGFRPVPEEQDVL